MSVHKISTDITPLEQVAVERRSPGESRSCGMSHLRRDSCNESCLTTLMAHESLGELPEIRVVSNESCLRTLKAHESCLICNESCLMCNESCLMCNESCLICNESCLMCNESCLRTLMAHESLQEMLVVSNESLRESL